MNMSQSSHHSAPKPAVRRFWLRRSIRLGVLALITMSLAATVYVRETGTAPSPPKHVTKTSTADEVAVFSSDVKLVPDEETMYTISHVGGSRAIEAVKKIVVQRDERFIPVLIEMLDANDRFPTAMGAGAHRHIFALRELVQDKKLNSQTSETLAGQWQGWYVNSKIKPPNGFTKWKGKLLGRVDRRYLDFFKPDSPARIPIAEIHYAGVKVDENPPLDHPRMQSAQSAGYLQPGEQVFGLEINGDARAYPLRILDWHEVVNDDIGGVPLLLSYCTLSDAGIAYDRRGPQGKTYTFGTSGLQYHCNRLLYDRETETLWSQLTGEPVVGPAAAENAALQPLPLVMTTWESWRKSHPGTTVLDIETGYKRRYFPGAANGDYFASAETRFPDVVTDSRLPLKTHVFGVRQGDVSVAFPVDGLAAKRVVNDVVGATPVVLVAPEGTITVEGRMRTRRRLPFRYNAGGLVRAYERGDQHFHAGSDASTLTDKLERRWVLTEDALVGPSGETLRRVNGFQSWWFAWSAFNPGTVVRVTP